MKPKYLGTRCKVIVSQDWLYWNVSVHLLVKVKWFFGLITFYRFFGIGEEEFFTSDLTEELILEKVKKIFRNRDFQRRNRIKLKKLNTVLQLKEEKPLLSRPSNEEFGLPLSSNLKIQ